MRRSTPAMRTTSSSSRPRSGSMPCSPSGSAIAQLVEADRSGDGDAQLARRVRLARLASEASQRDRAARGSHHRGRGPPRLAVLRATAGRLGGRDVNDNEIAKILRESSDRAERRAGLGRLEVDRPAGRAARARARALCATRRRGRSATATTSSFSLTLDELDETWLLALLDDLDGRLAATWARTKAAIDEGQRERLGLAGGRAAAALGLRRRVLPGRCRRRATTRSRRRSTHARPGRGRPRVLPGARRRRRRRARAQRPLPARRQEPARVLRRHRPPARRARARQLRAGRRAGSGTMVHELGHAVYDLAIDAELPWLLRQPAHTFTTEAIAMLHGRLVRDETFLERFAGVAPAIARDPRNARDAAPRAARVRALGAGHDALRARAVPRSRSGSRRALVAARRAPPARRAACGAAARRLGLQDPRRAGAGLLPQLPARRDHGIAARLGAGARDGLGEPGRRARRRRASSCASASCARARRCAGTR